MINVPKIIFHLIEDKSNIPKIFDIKLGLEKYKKINTNEQYLIDNKIFEKFKNKIKTNIIININGNNHKFIITLYNCENHITIFKSSIVGICCEIIQIYSDKIEIPLDKIIFYSEENQFIVTNFDKNENTYRRRFLIVNCSKNIRNITEFKKMKNAKNYIINLLPKDIIIQRNNDKEKEIKKVNLKNFNKFKQIFVKIDELIKIGKSKKDDVAISTIKKKLKSYKKYFYQNLINKGNCDWKPEEFISYYYFYKFKIFLRYIYTHSSEKIIYYYKALQIYEKIYKDLNDIFNATIYDKICIIKSLYGQFLKECNNKANKYSNIGEYKILNRAANEIKCYNLAFNFISEIIKNLKETSSIFLPLLQVNSDVNEDYDSVNKEKIFDISMLNLEMIKKNLESVIPKLIILVRNPFIKNIRGSTDVLTGTVFVYESTIFKNDIGKSYDELINEKPNDCAIIVSFLLLHEIFMHKNLRANCNFLKGKETPSKFIGRGFTIKNFYYTTNKKNKDPLSIYLKKKRKRNIGKIPKVGESGRILEYFFENERFEIIKYLMKYIGFGELLQKVDLIIDENYDELHDFIENKIKEGKIQPLRKTKKNDKPKCNLNKNKNDNGKINEDKEEDEEEERMLKDDNTDDEDDNDSSEEINDF